MPFTEDSLGHITEHNTLRSQVDSLLSAVGNLDQVDNTSDEDKPVSEAQAIAIAGKAPVALVMIVLKPANSSANLNRSGAPAGTGMVLFNTADYLPYTGTISGMQEGDMRARRV